MSKAKKRKHKGKKRVSGGEPTKRAKTVRADPESRRDMEARFADGHDRKRNNVGPSGQGPHRGRQRRTEGARIPLAR
jgi:hypothetical protein